VAKCPCTVSLRSPHPWPITRAIPPSGRDHDLRGVSSALKPLGITLALLSAQGELTHSLKGCSMKFFFLLVVPIFLASSSQAALYQAFCWAQVSSGVQCTQIKASLSYPTQGFACRQYALSLGSVKSGFFRDTDLERLKLKQEEVCNYVAHQPKWECFLESRCETSGGATSSLSPLSRYVFAPTGEADSARKACVTTAASEYLDALQGAGENCWIAARAVMTMP